ncbi:formyltransferase family protein [Leptospira sp. GIMC2001]|uniref:formyltransferase family protein n=1 Tax=Leptospira sp. GIMC2001 TaxID=1513297 RepID=UPI00234AC285|nr:formyltransferase family protein [Leptospira sp. GIMC2001]WCL48408.1 formyltransferase family protein [Leptospira sp. GIMC2001]
MYKYIVIGTSESTLACLEALVEAGEDITAIISLPKDLLPNNSINLKNFAAKYQVSYYEVSDINSEESEVLLTNLKPDYIISTWPKILKKNILKIPKMIIGTHPTPLPFNRGRHPIHWLIVLGIASSCVTFFNMDENVDNGKILSQVPFNIGSGNINQINIEMNRALKDGIISLVANFRNFSEFEGFTQNSDNSNIWRARNEHDITLDPRMSVSIVKRIVNSFLEPYPMARLFVKKGTYIKISKAEELSSESYPVNWRNFEHGQILNQKDNSIIFRVDDGMIKLYSKNLYEIENIKRIYPPSFYF